MRTSIQRILCTGIAILLFPCIAQAMPDKAGARFASADLNRDGFLDRKEFAKAFPTMKPEAFVLIDADKDGRIASAEWNGFFAGHGMGQEAARNTGTAPGSGQGSPNTDTSGALPLLPIPHQDARVPVPGAVQGSPEGTRELPLLSPPAR